MEEYENMVRLVEAKAAKTSRWIEGECLRGVLRSAEVYAQMGQKERAAYELERALSIGGLKGPQNGE